MHTLRALTTPRSYRIARSLGTQRDERVRARCSARGDPARNQNDESELPGVQ